jgi:hypothetical protein
VKESGGSLTYDDYGEKDFAELDLSWVEGSGVMPGSCQVIYK